MKVEYTKFFIDAETEMLKLEHWLCLIWQGIAPVVWTWENAPEFFDKGKNNW